MKHCMTFEDLAPAGWSEAARVWHQTWTAWVKKNVSHRSLIGWDPTHPWEQAIGKTEVEFRVIVGSLHAQRDPEWGYDRIDLRWSGTGWEDMVNGGSLRP